MVRASFLALQEPGHSPGQRYRVEAFEPLLEARGIAVRTDAILRPAELRSFYRGSAAAKAAVSAKALYRRLASLAQTPAPDVWLVQREAFFLGDAWAERLASRRAPVVYDFDDAIWIRAMSAANSRYAWLKNVDKIARVVALADTVIAGNAYLAEWASQHSARVRTIPTCVDTAHFTPVRERSPGPVVIGWSGSPSTIEHLRPLLPVLERLKARYRDRLQVRVMGDPSFHHAPLALDGERWTPEAELALLRRMDIGVMPLPDDPWTRGKCALKGLVSMAVGAATVMSPVGVNRAIVRDGVNGFLPASDDQWLQVLSRLVDDADLRATIGAAGRRTVEDDYSVTRWAPALAEALLAAAGRA